MKEEKIVIQTEQNIQLGVIFAIASALCGAIMGVFVKLIGNSQSTDTVVFARYFFGLLILLPWFFSESNLWVVHNVTKIFFRSITNLAAMACVFLSLKYLSVATVILLNNTFPLFVPILALIFLKVKTSFQMWLGIIIGFIGVIFVLQPHADSFNKITLIALLSGVLSAAAILQVRLLTKDTSTKQILFYFFVCCTIVSGLLLPLSFRMPTLYQLSLLILVGFFGSLSQVFITLAVKYIISRIVSVICFVSIIFAGIFDWVIWNHIPNLWGFLGVALVITGGALTILFSSSPASHNIEAQKPKLS